MTSRYHFATTDSTNAELKKLLKVKKLVDFTVVTASFQTAGKGQRNKKWESQADKNLLFSVVLNPRMLISEQFYLSKVVALAIVSLIRNLDVLAQIKWPNDIYISGKKVAGILIENVIKNSVLNTSILGIGINVNQSVFPDFRNYKATSLLNEVGRELDLEVLLDQFLVKLQQYYYKLKNNGYNEINKVYHDNLLWINQEKCVSINGIEKKVFIIGVEDDGRLKLKLLPEEKIALFEFKQLAFLAN